jgi:signal transduction histidine kinase/CheY-like chemotaxis protein
MCLFPSPFFRAILLLWIALGALVGTVKAQAPSKPSEPASPVLILISRHMNDIWAERQVRAMQEMLAAAPQPVTASVECLDWRTEQDELAQMEELTAFYANKFGGQDIRVVIAVEFPAVSFLLKQRDHLFPNAKAVLCGISYFDENWRASWATGQIENSDPAGTFRLATLLQPGLRTLVIPEDATGLGKNLKRVIVAKVRSAERRVKIELPSADSVHEVYAVVEHLPADAAVLLPRNRTVSQLSGEINERCPVPVYVTRSPTQLTGTIGGSLLDAGVAGRGAGRLALRVLAGEDPAKIPFEEVPRRLVADYQQLMRFGIPLTAVPPGCEILNRPPSFWMQHRPVLIASGVVVAVLGALVVALLVLLRQRRISAERLDRSLAVLGATFDSISDGVLVVDKRGRVTGYNRRFLSLWGVPPELGVGGDGEELLRFVLLQLKEPETFLRPMREPGGTDEGADMEEIECRDGRIFERDFRLQMQGGEAVGRVWSFRDVTARRRGEEERERLGARVAQGQKMEALGTLAGGIAHDFNNMLTGMLGCTQLALERLPKTHPAVDELWHSIECGERASGLVRQILTFSRQQRPAKTVVSLGPIIQDTLRLLRATAPAGVELAAALHPDVPPVLADPGQLHQALLNLCTNAIHAMGRGPGELRVILAHDEPPAETRTAHPKLPPGPLVSVSVIDTGHGMDTATLARVFEPFYSTKETGEGTGLGLAVVHGIVEAHDGAVAASSETGRGSTFTLFFPPAVAPIDETKSPAELDDPIPRGHGESILVVDDEPIVAEVAATLLRKIGYRAVTCYSAERALGLMQADADWCALVFTDLNMPRMTGLDLIRRLRHAGCMVPCVLTTGYVGSGGTEAEARTLGLGDIVEKPFTDRSLGRAIAAELDRARCAGAAQ